MAESAHRSNRAGGVGTVLLLSAAMVLASCDTNHDPRAGGFVSGVSNLTTGGYRSFVNERNDELKQSKDRSHDLQSRARAIEAEREALDKDIETASAELEAVQERIAKLSQDLNQAKRRSAAEAEKLETARKQAGLARKRLSSLLANTSGSIASRRQSIKDLRALIGNVALLVKDLST